MKARPFLYDKIEVCLAFYDKNRVDIDWEKWRRFVWYIQFGMIFRLFKKD